MIKLAVIKTMITLTGNAAIILTDCRFIIELSENKSAIAVILTPFLNAPHLCKMRIRCIHNPFRERIKQYISCKSTGKHHASPCKKKNISVFHQVLPAQSVHILNQQ